MEEKKVEQPQQHTQAQLINMPIPKAYTNGYNIKLSLSDLIITFHQNGQPFLVMNMSFITAKSLMQEIEKALKSFETNSGVLVPDMKTIAESISKATSKKEG